MKTDIDELIEELNDCLVGRDSPSIRTVLATITTLKSLQAERDALRENTKELLRLEDEHARHLLKPFPKHTMSNSRQLEWAHEKLEAIEQARKLLGENK